MGRLGRGASDTPDATLLSRAPGGAGKAGDAVALDLATRAGLGRALQSADADESFRPGIGLLPGRVFTVVVNNKKFISSWSNPHLAKSI